MSASALSDADRNRLVRHAMTSASRRAPMTSSTTSTATPPRHGFERAMEEVNLSKTDLNAVVMNYLITEGYPSAAQKFAHEANIEPMPDLESIHDRVQVRESIHSGAINTAIKMINELDPELFDKEPALHFSLLRLELIELIRKATATPDGDIAPALRYATTHLAPRAPTNPEFLEDLERTMALLIFPPHNLAPPLAALLQPSLRQEVAQRVNKALLKSCQERTKATLFDLVNHRSWAYQKALEAKKEVPERLELGFDPAQNGNEGSQNGTSHRQNPISHGNGAENTGAARDWW